MRRLFTLPLSSATSRTRNRFQARPRVENLEDRLAPAGITRVPDTFQYPARATVQIEAVWDTNRNGRPDRADAIATGSGALVDHFHVVTAGHVLYGNERGSALSGFARWVFVHPGRNDQFFRPYGEVRATKMRVPAAWTEGDNKADIGIITLDRNIGAEVGWYAYASASDGYFANGADINILGYPGDSRAGFDGVKQFYATGPVRQYSSFEFKYLHSEVPTFPGVSGSPVFVQDPDLGQTIIGVHVRGTTQNGVKVNAATRITSRWVNFIDKARRDDARPRDLPDVVDFGVWFNQVRQATTVSANRVRAGQNFRINTTVFNAGTADANNVRVRFALSTDRVFDSRDKVLGDTTVRHVDAFATARAGLSANLPRNLGAGKYFVVWSIDPANRIREFSTTMDRMYGINPDAGFTVGQIQVVPAAGSVVRDSAVASLLATRTTPAASAAVSEVFAQAGSTVETPAVATDAGSDGTEPGLVNGMAYHRTARNASPAEAVQALDTLFRVDATNGMAV